MATTTYYRLNVTAHNDPARNWIQMAEWKAYTVASPSTSVLTGGTPTAQYGDNGTNVLSNLFDGNSGTWFAPPGPPGTLPSWIQYVLSSAQDIVKYSLQWRGDYTDKGIDAWALQRSLDSGSTWQTLHSVSGATDWTAGETRTFLFTHGYVEKGGTPVSSRRVTAIKASDGTFIKSTTTDANGFYSLDVTAAPAQDVIVICHGNSTERPLAHTITTI